MKSRYEWLLGCAVVAAAGGIALALEEGTPTAKPEPRKTDPAVEAWVAGIAPRITDGNEVVRRSAFQAMMAVGPDALPVLGKLAGSDDPRTAGTAMDLIAAIKNGGPREHRGPSGPGGPEGMRHGPGGPGGPGHGGRQDGPPPSGGPEGMRHGPGGPGGMGGGPGGPEGPGRMLEDLGLTEEQRAKVQEVLKATHERIRKETEVELQKILSPEQWKKMQEGRESRGPQGPGPGHGR